MKNSHQISIIIIILYKSPPLFPLALSLSLSNLSPQTRPPYLLQFSLTFPPRFLFSLHTSLISLSLKPSPPLFLSHQRSDPSSPSLERAIRSPNQEIEPEIERSISSQLAEAPRRRRRSQLQSSSNGSLQSKGNALLRSDLVSSLSP